MSNQPKLTDLDLWTFYEHRFIRLLHEALAALRERSPTENEPELNRQLFFAVQDVTFKASQLGEHLPAFIPEAKNPPSPSDPERTHREDKIPDFRWAFNDPQAKKSDDMRKEFVVEAKRLANPRSRFATEYVRSGINRFIDPDWGYAQDMKSGAMVGYIQEITFDDATSHVTGRNAKETLPKLRQTERNSETSATFDQLLNRPFPINPFKLFHIWARIGPEPNP